MAISHDFITHFKLKVAHLSLASFLKTNLTAKIPDMLSLQTTDIKSHDNKLYFLTLDISEISSASTQSSKLASLESLNIAYPKSIDFNSN